MARMKRHIRGYTLVETLVMMLVAGIVFLGAMDALTLVTRLCTRRAAALYATGAQREGFYRIEQLLATADSLTVPDGFLSGYGSGEILLRWHAGKASRFVHGDSVLVYHAGTFSDTLLRKVGGIVLLQNRRCDGIGLTDTLSIEIEGHTFKFAWQPPAQERYKEMIAEIEEAHGYENPGSETY